MTKSSGRYLSGVQLPVGEVVSRHAELKARSAVVELRQFGNGLLQVAVDITVAHSLGVPAQEVNLPITPAVVRVGFARVPRGVIDLHQKAARRIRQIRVNEVAGWESQWELSFKAREADSLKRPRQSKFVVGRDRALAHRTVA